MTLQTQLSQAIADWRKAVADLLQAKEDLREAQADWRKAHFKVTRIQAMLNKQGVQQ